MSLRETAFPRSICLRVTRRCNAACAFCQAPNTSRDELSVDEIGCIAQGLSTQGVLTVKLSGGEPTVRRELAEILEVSARRGLKPVVVTNGIRMRREVVESAADVGAEFKISVHRPDAANDLVLGVKSFRRIVENMATLREMKVPFSIHTVLTPRTVDIMDSMASFAMQVGARKISFIPVVPRGRAGAKEDYTFSIVELNALRGRISELRENLAGRLLVRCIDFRRHDYWTVENDGSLWIERWREDLDTWVCKKEDLLILGQEQPVGGHHA